MTRADAGDLPLVRCPIYVPAHRRSMVEKALDGRTGADAVIIDLEDGVPRDAREAAEATMAWLRTVDAVPLPVYCRIRGASDAARGDLRLVPPWSDGVVLAKAESLELVGEIAHEAPSFSLWLLIESARGVEALPSLLSGAPVRGIMLGGADLRADLRARPTDDDAELSYARGRMVVVAAAYGVANVVDTPESAIDDPQRLTEVTTRVRALGFTGKACIHPSQVPVVSGCFAPTPEEVDWARGVLATADGAQRFHGELVDEATKRRARAILAGPA